MKKISLSIMFLLIGFSIYSLDLEGNSSENNNKGEAFLSLSVEEAIDLALRNNTNLQNGVLDVKAKAFAKNSSWNVYLPSLNANVGLSRSNSPLGITNPKATTEEEQRWMMNMGVSLNFLLTPSSFRQMYQAFIDYDSQKLSFEKLQKQMKRDVSKMYYKILALEQSIENLKMQIENATSRYNQTLTNYRNGLTDDLKVLQAEVALENLKPSLGTLQLNYDISLMSFRNLLGLPLEEPIKLTSFLETVYINLDEKTLINAVSSTLEMKELSLGIKSLENQRKTQVDALFPSFSLGYSWSPSTKGSSAGGIIYPFTNGSFDNIDWGAGSLTLGLSWNIDSLLPWSSAGVSRHTIKIEEQKLRNTYSQSIKDSVFDLKSQVTKLKVYASTIEATKSALNLAQKSYAATDRAYRAGREELLTVSDAALQVDQAEMDLLNAQIDYIDTILDLEYTMGGSLEPYYLLPI